MLDGLALYDAGDPTFGLPFTYPPFAAVVMVPLALVPGWLAAALWTAASVGAMAGSVVVVRRALGRPSPGWLVAVVTAAALALEPVWQNLAFGQVNAILMLAVLVDLLGPGRRWSGVLIGVAAGIKLTPLVFVILLVLVGRRTQAGRALLAFAVTVGLGFVAMPGPPGRTGPTGWWTRAGSAPRSWRTTSRCTARSRDCSTRPPPTVLWLAVMVPIALAFLGVGALSWRRGDPPLGTCLAAISMLVASPIAWSHHWVWAVPIALVLWERRRWVAVAWTAVFVARPILWPPWGEDREFGWNPLEHVVGHAYLLAALAVVVWAALRLERRPATLPRSTPAPLP